MCSGQPGSDPWYVACSADVGRGLVRDLPDAVDLEQVVEIEPRVIGLATAPDQQHTCDVAGPSDLEDADHRPIVSRCPLLEHLGAEPGCAERAVGFREVH